jgi:dTDP-4-amino-4,6-dideoxygalactose transaminase
MIPITIPCLGDEEQQAVGRVLESGWLTQGPRVAEFERAVADYCGAPHAVAVSSCTAALHLALLALDIGPGDEVVCPSMSFIATANAIRYTGAAPVFADVDPATYNITASTIRAVLTPRTKAILLVHQVGMPADLDPIRALADRFGLLVVEDAACAIGSRYKGRPIGAQGEMVCFSFHPRKVISTGEGGMILTPSAEHAARLRLLRQHGMSVTDAVRHQSRDVIVERYVSLGYNYRMTDMQAAIGIEQMKRLDWICQRRRHLADRYTQALAGHPWLRAPHVPAYAEPNFQSYPVQLADNAPISRDELMQQLLDQGIATRRGIMLAHREAPYAGSARPGQLTASERASDRSVLLPLFPQMSEQQQQTVVEALENLPQSVKEGRGKPQAAKAEGERRTSEDRRVAHAIRRMVGQIELDLKDLCVLTEAATGPYVVTPVLAAVAGARVVALARGSRHGTAEQIRRQTYALAEQLGVSQRIEIVEQLTPAHLAAADIVTNSGHLRPLDAQKIQHLRPGTAIPTMYEAWELRAGDIDLEACLRQGVVVAGTNEQHPQLRVFDYLGMLAIRGLMECRIPVPFSRLLLVSDNPFATAIGSVLSSCGAEVTVFNAESHDSRSHYDAVILADTPSPDHWNIGSAGAKHTPDELGSFDALVQVWGDVDRDAIPGVRFYPLEAPAGGHMGVQLSDLGHEPIIRLQAGGLKVGEVLARRSSAPNALAYCQPLFQGAMA